MFEIQSALLVYVLGIVIGLTVMRDPWPARLVTALVWPLGPIAFVIVVAIMLVTAAILWPVMILGSAAVLGAVIYMTAC
jgi:hypothetical protein